MAKGEHAKLAAVSLMGAIPAFQIEWLNAAVRLRSCMERMITG